MSSTEAGGSGGGPFDRPAGEPPEGSRRGRALPRAAFFSVVEPPAAAPAPPPPQPVTPTLAEVFSERDGPDGPVLFDTLDLTAEETPAREAPPRDGPAWEPARSSAPPPPRPTALVKVAPAAERADAPGEEPSAVVHPLFAAAPVEIKPTARPEPTEEPAAPLRRRGMFDDLVDNETDVVGFVAYGLYKLSKRDWIEAHALRTHRPPTQVEVDSFVIGERTARRIATYRRLAADILAADAPRAPDASTPADEPSASARSSLTPPSPDRRPPMARAMPPAQPKPDLGRLLTRLALLAAGVVAAGLAIRLLLPLL
jgi:hypothetical protein